MTKIRNIKEFSMLAGVSTATVSRALEGSDKVRPETRERICRLAREYGFRVNQIAKSQRSGKTRTVGVLLHRLSTSFFADIAVGIQEVLYPAGYLPVVCSLPRATEPGALRDMIDRRVDGVIGAIGARSFSEDELTELRRFNLPVVTVDARRGERPWDNVCSDEPGIGKIAAERLLAAGYRRIGAIHPDWDSPRIRGFREALSAHGVTPRVFTLEHLADAGDDAGIFCFNDLIAAELCRRAAELKLRIPEQLGVIGSADLNFAEWLTPPLTTVRQDGAGIGRAAARQLLKRLGGDDSEPVDLRLPVTLAERGTVRVPRLIL